MDPTTAFAEGTSAISLMDTFTALSFILSVVGGVLGTLSIVVTWKLYQAGSTVNTKTYELLADVTKSSHTTEVTSVHYTERLISAFIELVQREVRESVAVGEESLKKRFESVIRDELGSVSNKELLERVRQKVLDDVKDTFQTLQLQAAAAAQIAEPVPITVAAAGVVPHLDPGAPRVVRWIAGNETKYQFFSVMFLRCRVFAGDPAAQRGLDYCIANGLLETYDQPNPKNPKHPTLACRLNRANRSVTELLR